MALIITNDIIYTMRKRADAYVTGTPSEQPEGSFGLLNPTAGEWIRFGLFMLGEVAYDAAIAFDTGFIKDDCISLPPDANPPFPPVWPYTWNTSLLYGREHLGQNLKMIREDDFRFRVTITKNGVAVNITGATFTFSVKWAKTDAGTIFTRTLASGLTVFDAAAGQLDVHIASANTSGLPSYTVILPYDIEMVETTGDISTPLIGNLTVVPDIT